MSSYQYCKVVCEDHSVYSKRDVAIYRSTLGEFKHAMDFRTLAREIAASMTGVSS
jgi:hypothetical protein